LKTGAVEFTGGDWDCIEGFEKIAGFRNRRPHMQVAQKVEVCIWGEMQSIVGGALVENQLGKAAIKHVVWVGRKVARAMWWSGNNGRLGPPRS
jgi:hypothetical protein